MSFAEPGKFLGAIVTEADSLVEAIKKTHRLGVNPGGDIMSAPVADQYLVNLDLFPKDRLLTREDLASIDEQAKARNTIPPEETQGASTD